MSRIFGGILTLAAIMAGIFLWNSSNEATKTAEESKVVANQSKEMSQSAMTVAQSADRKSDQAIAIATQANANSTAAVAIVSMFNTTTLIVVLIGVGVFAIVLYVFKIAPASAEARRLEAAARIAEANAKLLEAQRYAQLPAPSPYGIVVPHQRTAIMIGGQDPRGR